MEVWLRRWFFYQMCFWVHSGKDRAKERGRERERGREGKEREIYWKGFLVIGSRSFECCHCYKTYNNNNNNNSYTQVLELASALLHIFLPCHHTYICVHSSQSQFPSWWSQLRCFSYVHTYVHYVSKLMHSCIVNCVSQWRHLGYKIAFSGFAQ
jgi:hypothetical protein